MDEWDIEKAVSEIIEAKIAEEREVEIERLRKQFEPIAMLTAANVSAFQLFGFSRIEAIGMALEFMRMNTTGGKKNGK